MTYTTNILWLAPSSVW